MPLTVRKQRIIRRSTFGMLGLLVIGLVASWVVAGWLVAPQPNTIGVVGISLGGASALLASPLGIDALILESIYPSGNATDFASTRTVFPRVDGHRAEKACVS